MVEIDGVNLRNIVIDTVIVGTVAYAFNVGDLVGVAAYTITNIAIQNLATQYNSALRNSFGVALGLYVSYGFGYDLREDWNWAKLELARGIISQIGLVLNNLHQNYISDDRIRVITQADSIC